ncbi:GNAT family N-acetyltransferase [Sulfitobacter sabulilitoris]|uniref:GNAT family N-acetyltransferase n=1 Tax=Sulfitobacter sabulilitoris TaxID=2562655 RepID=A0A5S3PET2_9RHOB|nr:GNAT family N-acetyltransferase [Sulfitobacter sabulilitoris]TMM52537.1 GNAT family N-acetyltransferase [Sulfitobacter sabulilitoris]
MSVTVSQTGDLAACHALRRTVFIIEQNVAEHEELDGLDAQALHLLAVEGDTPVGTARILVKDGTAKIGRVCVLSAHRGTGLGARIMQAAIELAGAQPGVTQARLGAQLHALGFYEKLGFTACGPVYDDAGIDHRDMVRAL